MDRSAKACLQRHAEWAFDRSTLLTMRAKAYAIRDIATHESQRQARSGNATTMLQGRKFEALAEAINEILKMQEGDFS